MLSLAHTELIYPYILSRLSVQYKMRIRKASSKFFADSSLGYSQFFRCRPGLPLVSMQISAKYFTCPQLAMFSLRLFMATNLLARGVATRPQINSTTLKQESIGILKKVVGPVERGRNWQLELQLHARAIRWRVELENKVYLTPLLLPLDMSLLDRLASSGSCFLLAATQLK